MSTSDGDYDTIRAFYRSLLELEDDKRVGWGTNDAALRNHAAVLEIFRDWTDGFDLYEVGCGLGKYAQFVQHNVPRARYRGCDLLEEMVAGARSAVPGAAFEVRDVVADPPAPADFVVAMGAFNVSGGMSDAEWTAVVERVLRAMFGFARKGIAVSFLTDRVDWKRAMGHYRDPFAIARFAETELSRFVELRCGYYPWEFTLHVLREPRPLHLGPAPVRWPPESREPRDRNPW